MFEVVGYGILYVLCEVHYGHRILSLNCEDGQYVKCMGRGSGDGHEQLSFPYGIAFNQSNNYIYVCDTSNCRIQVFNPNNNNNNNGNVVCEIGKNELRSPMGIQYTEDIYLYVILDEW